MTLVKILTWNVRDVRNKIKRTAVLAYLKAQRANIMALTDARYRPFTVCIEAPMDSLGLPQHTPVSIGEFRYW